MNISVSCPYTCGELFQGSLDGEPCLVSAPISIYSEAVIGQGELSSYLPEKADKALFSLSLKEKPCIFLRQGLPSSHGYGTSTADIGSVLFASAKWADMPLSESEATRIAVSVEPSDSSLLPGLALLDHRQGKVMTALGEAPKIAVIVLDPGGTVDSVAFNSQDWSSQLKKNKFAHREIFELLQRGISQGDIAAIGEAATRSAIIHENILPSSLLNHSLRLAKELRASGICRAHSGTIFGLLFPAAVFDSQSIIAYLRKQVPKGVQVWQTKMTGGGWIDTSSKRKKHE
jgi:L-threonine kinase